MSICRSDSDRGSFTTTETVTSDETSADNDLSTGLLSRNSLKSGNYSNISSNEPIASSSSNHLTFVHEALTKVLEQADVFVDTKLVDCDETLRVKSNKSSKQRRTSSSPKKSPMDSSSSNRSTIQKSTNDASTQDVPKLKSIKPRAAEIEPKDGNHFIGLSKTKSSRQVSLRKSKSLRVLPSHALSPRRSKQLQEGKEELFDKNCFIQSKNHEEIQEIPRQLHCDPMKKSKSARSMNYNASLDKMSTHDQSRSLNRNTIIPETMLGSNPSRLPKQKKEVDTSRYIAVSSPMQMNELDQSQNKKISPSKEFGRQKQNESIPIEFHITSPPTDEVKENNNNDDDTLHSTQTNTMKSCLKKKTLDSAEMENDRDNVTNQNEFTVINTSSMKSCHLPKQKSVRFSKEISIRFLSSPVKNGSRINENGCSNNEDSNRDSIAKNSPKRLGLSSSLHDMKNTTLHHSPICHDQSITTNNDNYSMNHSIHRHNGKKTKTVMIPSPSVSIKSPRAAISHHEVENRNASVPPRTTDRWSTPRRTPFSQRPTLRRSTINDSLTALSLLDLLDAE